MIFVYLMIFKCLYQTLKFSVRRPFLKVNMIYHYESYFSNHVHQLVVSISKHLYLLKNKEIKYQKKFFNINLKNYSKSTKSHLVRCIIEDYFSGRLMAKYIERINFFQ